MEFLLWVGKGEWWRMMGNLEFCPLCIFQNTNTDTHTLFCVREKTHPKCIITQGLGTSGIYSSKDFFFFFGTLNKGCAINEFGPRGTFTVRNCPFSLVIGMLSCTM